MLKKVFLTICCLSVVSVALICWGATSWQLQTKINNTGGSIKIRDKALQTASGSIVYHNFTSSAAIPAAVKANIGYRISALTRNGMVVPIGNYTSNYSTTFQKSGGTPQALVAGFSTKLVTVTGKVVGPGTISPASANIAYGSTVTLSSTPSNTSSYLIGVTGGTVADLNGAQVTFPYRGTVKITVTQVTEPRTVTATYSSYTVNAGIDQLAQIKTPVTLQGSMTGGGSPSWSQVSGPAATLSGANTLALSFTPSTAGTYLFKLTQSVFGTPVASDTTEVDAVDSLADNMRSRCMGCHGSNGVYPARYVFVGWSSSSHRPAGVSCITCHTESAMPTPINANTVDSNTLAYRSGAGNFCLNGTCHSPGATHSSNGMVCAGCHGNYRNHNPSTTFSAALGACFTCHGGANTTHYYTKVSLAMNQCLICHAPSGHNPAPDPAVTPAHFNGYTSYVSGYAAAYVTPATLCADCHQGGDPKGAADLALLQYRREWAGSGHGRVGGAAWENSATRDWKVSGVAGANAKASASIATDCQRCHTALGYLQFARYTSIAPVSATTAGYSEPLTCNACHPSGDFSGTQSFGPRTGYYNYSSVLTGRLPVSAVLPDSGKSNICLGCHVGRKAGDTVEAMALATVQRSYSSSFWRDVRFVDSHYLTAGGQLFGVTGYHYPDQTYQNGSLDHTGVGAGTPQGPCVACHMPGSSHTLSSGSAGYTLCNSCHLDSGTVSSSFLIARDDEFRAGLKALAAALTEKGFPPVADADGAPQYPYFSAKNWGGASDAPGTMGAAFNYNLLVHDPGAFAHNPAYSKRLVRDSIDFLTSGSVDRTRDLTEVINALLASSTDRQDAQAFLNNAANGTAACQVCHANALDPLTGDNIFSDYNASMHATKPGGARCLDCHAPGATVAHPAADMLTKTDDINAKCLACHPLHTWESQICSKCHNGHNLKVVLPPPHFASFSTAQYVTPKIECTNCHEQSVSPGETTFFIVPANREWADSAKAQSSSPAYINYDFKTMGTPAPATTANSVSTDCVRCHTTTGFRSYVTSDFTDISAWGISGLAPDGDRTREMIACPACHNPTPFDAGFSRLSVGVVDESSGAWAVKSWYNYSSVATKKIVRSKLFTDVGFSDLGDSNICITCHAGKAVGDLIKQTTTNISTGAITCSPLAASIVCRLGNGKAADGLTGTFWGNVDFIDPHGGLASNLIFPDNLRPGYEYRAAALTTTHGNIALDTSKGPCVGCHMSSPGKHAFKAFSTASNGVIASVTSDVCNTCHGDIAFTITVEKLQEKKTAYNSSLSVIASQLATRGIFYNRNQAPYFFNTSEPAQQSWSTRTVNWNYSPTFQGAHLMGAAFNLRLLDSGSGWVHNGLYAKRLLYDTIDYLDDGLQNRITTATVTDPKTYDYLDPRL